jgi:hypothetical protein
MEEQSREEQPREKERSPMGMLLLGTAVVAGWFVTHWSHRRMVRRVAEELREEIQQLRRVTELAKAVPASTERLVASPQEPAVISTPATAQAQQVAEEISPELMVVLASAITAFVGKKVRIHQARLVNPEVVSPWAQQGRVNVQASHYLAGRH